MLKQVPAEGDLTFSGDDKCAHVKAQMRFPNSEAGEFKIQGLSGKPLPGHL